MDVKVVVIFALVIHLSHFAKVEGFNEKLSADKDLELARQNRRLDEHSVKTIKVENGDTYECVDFYKQPAFDNPLLKDNISQYKMKPTFKNSSMSSIRVKKEGTEKQDDMGIELRKERCPSGTVPIRRSSKEDIITQNLFEEESHALNANTETTGLRLYYALARTKASKNRKYRGAGAVISAYNPRILDKRYYSSARISIQRGRENIKFGWIVNPGLYNETTTRIFTSFVGRSASCFNTLCPGFIIVNSELGPDAYVDGMSTRGVLPTYAGYYFVQQDVVGNWWLQLGSRIETAMEIGYWPKRLFSASGLADFATEVTWGGSAFGKLPRMGNGHLPRADTMYDAYFRLVSVMNDARQIVSEDDDLELFADSNFYDVKDMGRRGSSGRIITFGGPLPSTI